MALDFDRLVLGPAMRVFARPVRVYPVRSQPPGTVYYAARGIWRRQPADMMLEDGGVLGTDVLTLGVRISEFAVLPVKGDRVYIPASLPLTHIGLCEIDDDGEDGQGGYNWTLKIIDPAVIP